MTTATYAQDAGDRDCRRDIYTVARKLLTYCRANDFSGYDPYDALNSRAVQSWPLLDSRWPRLVLTQALKRSPINIRKILGVPRTQNPKAIALFISAVLNAPELDECGGQELAVSLAEMLVTLRSDSPYWCWGYSFPWQTRTMLVPRAAPNLVCTTFVANALLDLYDVRRDSRWLEMATSSAKYILNELYWTDGSVSSFSYPFPSAPTRIHNANLLAAALLCRLYTYTGEQAFVEPAIRAARYSSSRQRKDGSWPYGEDATQLWI